MPQVLFTWHGGETLMRPLSFIKGTGIAKEIRPQTPDRQLYPDKWDTAERRMVRVLPKNNFLVGVSIDGPQEFHDEYRNKQMGTPSFRQSDARD